MPALNEVRFSVTDYYRLAETGVLPRGARVELLAGRIIDKAPISPLHSGMVNRLNRIFNAPSGGRWQIAVQNPVTLDDFFEPEPDLSWLHPAPDDYQQRHPQPGDIFLLIEVADATLAFDREEKLPVYGRAGIPEVWIANLNEAVLEGYRNPHANGYATRMILPAGEPASPQAFPDVLVRVAELFKR